MMYCYSNSPLFGLSRCLASNFLKTYDNLTSRKHLKPQYQDLLYLGIFLGHIEGTIQPFCPANSSGILLSIKGDEQALPFNSTYTSPIRGAFVYSMGELPSG